MISLSPSCLAPVPPGRGDGYGDNIDEEDEVGSVESGAGPAGPAVNVEQESPTVSATTPRPHGHGQVHGNPALSPLSLLGFPYFRVLLCINIGKFPKCSF